MIIILLVIACICFISGLFTGFWLQKRNPNYDGKIVINKTDDKTVYSLELDGDPDEIQNKRSISFEVVPHDDTFAE
jgi:hypothetical protein